jgi:1-acyl-sn-glycerol-3-phosphate acyltransferase
MIVLRSALFMVCQFAITPLFALGVFVAAPFGDRASYAVARAWCRAVLYLVASLCGLRYRVEGLHNIPDRAVVVLAKHQSAWETILFMALFPRQVQLVKRELLWVPFFGWALALLHPIAIDRKAGRAALEQLLRQGRERLAKGLWVIVFPEGTRTAPGDRREYAVGGAWLAARSGTPVLPVAHNAGLFWRRKAFLKYPGTITVSIGPVIPGTDANPKELNRRAEEWIESEVRRIGPEGAAHDEARRHV